MYILVERHLSRVHLSRANFLYSHDLSDAQLTWNKVKYFSAKRPQRAALSCARRQSKPSNVWPKINLVQGLLCTITTNQGPLLQNQRRLTLTRALRAPRAARGHRRCVDKYVVSHPQNTKRIIFNFPTGACDLVLALLEQRFKKSLTGDARLEFLRNSAPEHAPE